MKSFCLLFILLNGCAWGLQHGFAIQDCITEHVKALNRNNAEISPQLYERISDECRANFKIRPVL